MERFTVNERSSFDLVKVFNMAKEYAVAKNPVCRLLQEHGAKEGNGNGQTPFDIAKENAVRNDKLCQVLQAYVDKQNKLFDIQA